eukprot:2834593-Amphidinium_carterae.1
MHAQGVQTDVTWYNYWLRRFNQPQKVALLGLKPVLLREALHWHQTLHVLDCMKQGPQQPVNSCCRYRWWFQEVVPLHGASGAVEPDVRTHGRVLAVAPK